MADYIRWLRGQVGPALLPLVFATAIVRDSSGRILFQRRSDFGSAYAWWGLPGGLFEPGETPEGCLRREMLEEIPASQRRGRDLRVEPRRLTSVYSSARYRVTYPNGDQVQQVTLCYECEWLDGDLRPEPGEVDALAFFAPDALPQRPLWYADMLDHAQNGSPPPYFDPPERAHIHTPYLSLPSVQAVLGRGSLVWPTARAAVLDEAGRLLLQRSSVTVAWSLPGGPLETGESLAHTAVRATREQTGLEIVPTALLGVFAGEEVVCASGERLYPVATLLACRASGRATRTARGQDRATDAAFFDRDQLPALSASERVLAQAALTTGA